MSSIIHVGYRWGKDKQAIRCFDVCRKTVPSRFGEEIAEIAVPFL